MKQDESIATLAEALVSELIDAEKTVATAESCTGGWIAKSLTDIAGSSACLGYGVVSYSNGAKESMLGVDSRILQEHGAVSEAVVRAMAEGILHLSGADYSVAVSGIAGPGGGTTEKPVGTIWIAWAKRYGNETSLDAQRHVLSGDRESIRAQTVILGIQGIRERLKASG